MTLTLRRVPPGEAPPLESFPDHSVFQTRSWLSFLEDTQRAEPVTAEVRNGREVVGRFTGAIVRKFGMSVLGSPFPGWTTSYQGFNLVDATLRPNAFEALSRFAFNELKCVHVEVMDRRVRRDTLESLGYRVRPFPGYEIDLSQTEDDLFANMTSACRRCIRKARKSGVTVEETTDTAFVEDYYPQLEDVFAKQGLVPTYGPDRVRALVEHIAPTGRLLLLRARNQDGDCIASGIFPAMNDTMYFWGGASWRPHQHLRPNEAIQWYAMRYWKKQGIGRYDMGGGGNYKAKYGGAEILVPWGRQSKYSLLEKARNAAQSLQGLRQRWAGRGRT